MLMAYLKMYQHLETDIAAKKLSVYVVVFSRLIEANWENSGGICARPSFGREQFLHRPSDPGGLAFDSDAPVLQRRDLFRGGSE
jgi:hypothetical protein